MEPVKVFYEKLHAISQAIDCLRPNEHINPNDVAHRQKEIDVDQVYDFLGGLDPPYNGVRSRILAQSPILSPLEAYHMVMEEDTRQSAMLGGVAALKVDSACSRSIAHHDSIGHLFTQSSNASSGSGSAGSAHAKFSSLQRPRKCSHCGGDHCSEKCFKEHGYLDWFAYYQACIYGPKATCIITQGKTDFPTPSAHLCAFDTLPGEGTIHLTPSLSLSHALLDLKTHETIGHEWHWQRQTTNLAVASSLKAPVI
ncbi:unnamed protein product [Prunus armeniaca]